MIIQHSEHFDRCYQSLPPNIQKKVQKALRFLVHNPWHPSLHVEKIDTERNIWSGRVDRGVRFTFQWIPGGLILRNLGPHETAYRRP